MRRFLFLALLALGSCDPGGREIPGTGGPPDICEPVPAECPEVVECTVTPEADGTKTCGGETCCQAFCDLNGCDRCCANAVPEEP